MDIMEQQHDQLASIITAALRSPGDWARRSEQTLEQANAAILPSSIELKNC